MTASELLERLEGVRPIAGGWSCRCPGHDDKRQSLSVSQGDGKILLHCHAECPPERVVSALGLEMRDLYTVSDSPPRRNGANGAAAPIQQPITPPLKEREVGEMERALRADPSAWQHVTGVLRFAPEVVERLHLGLLERSGRRWLAYPYHASTGWVVANCRSIDGDKDFLRYPSGQRTVLYGVDALRPNGVVLVTEGERDTAAALTMGLAAELGGGDGAAVVAFPGASQAKVAIEALRGQRLVYVATDADEAGDKAAAALMSGLGLEKCRRVRLKRHKDLGDVLSDLGPDEGAKEALRAVRAADEEGQDPSGVRKMLRGGLRRFTVEELSTPPPRQDFILHPYIPARTVTTIAGPGGSSKTTLLTCLAVCRALGLPFFDHNPKRGRTVILTTEDGREDYLRKLAALREELGEAFDAATIAENVLLIDMAGIPLRLVETDKGNWRPTSTPEHLAAVLQSDAQGADLVILETVSRLAGGVETNESLSILVESAQRLCMLASVAVVLVAHVSQEAGRQGFADAYAPRGGSALGDNGRSTMVLTRINENNRKQFCPDAELTRDLMERLLVLTHPKSNGVPGARPLLLERITTHFGPALRPASLKADEGPTPETRGRVCRAIGDLAAQGVMVTRTLMKERNKALGLTRDDLLDAIEAALKNGELAERVKPGKGGGLMLVPTGRGTLRVVDGGAEDNTASTDGSRPPGSAELTASATPPGSAEFAEFGKVADTQEKKSAEEVGGEAPKMLADSERADDEYDY